MNKEEQQAIADAMEENKNLVDQRKAYQESHKHWTTRQQHVKD